jgi:hypothetical protein
MFMSASRCRFVSALSRHALGQERPADADNAIDVCDDAASMPDRTRFDLAAGARMAVWRWSPSSRLNVIALEK